MILGEQENIFLFKFGLIVPTALKCLFRHNFCRPSLPTAGKLPLFGHFCSNQKNFLHVYNIEQPGQT